MATSWPVRLPVRAVTLDEFLREEEQMARDHVSDSSTRPIPALLAPHETLQQYEQSFRLWLGRRNVTLQDDATVERRFRLDFADSRAWELRRRNIANAQKSADKSTSSSSNQDPPNEEKPASPTTDRRVAVRLSDNDKGRHQYRGARSRGELLATRVMTADQFQVKMEYFGPNGDMFAGSKLNPIPVVLRVGETLGEFEANFKRWLASKNVVLHMLQDDPEEERRYRQCFAYARAREHARRESLHARQSPSRCSQSPTRRRTASSGDSRKSRSPKRRRSDSDPPTLSLTALTSQERTRSSSKDRWNANREPENTGLPLCIRTWAEEMNQRVKQLETQLQRSFRGRPSAPTSAERSSARDETSSQSPEVDRSTPSHAGSRGVRAHSRRPTSATMDMSRNSQANEGTTAAPPSLFVVDNQDTDADVVMVKVENRTHQPRRSSAFRAAADTLAESERLNMDPLKQRLVEDYTSLNDRIATNETAIEDSLAYVNLIVNIDKAGTAEQLSQVKTLTVSTNKEKRRRDNVLATLIAHEWAGKQEELEQLVLHTRIRDGSHEKLVSMYAKLKKKRQEVAAVQATLENRVSWFSAEDVITDPQILELEELQSKLASELSTLCRLENRRQALCVELLKAHEGVHRLVTALIEESKHSGHSTR